MARWFAYRAVFGTATFRLTIGSAAFMAAALLLQSAVIFWQATASRAARSDFLLAREAALLAAQSAPVLDLQLRMRASDDLHLLITAAGLFDANRHPLRGNLRDWPAGLSPDGRVYQITIHPTDQPSLLVRAQAQSLPDGHILVLARATRDFEDMRRIVIAALTVCALPSILIAMAGGIWLSHRALVRVGVMHRAIERIMHGDLHGRLPAGRGRDDLDRLAGSVNRMLDRLEHLVDEIKGVGDDIAHDLRTPLARVRTRLDRARSASLDPETMDHAIERALADLDQCFSIITALLRISEIENGRRRAAFAVIRLDEIVADIIDLYEPIAEAAEIRLQALPSDAAVAHGDRDLLIELVANLIDNAIKFTAAGGKVDIEVESSPGHVVLRVTDTGIGIPRTEREAVFGRFYRSDKSRHVQGSGLGLSLVSAIGRLHDATFRVGDTNPGLKPPGCRIEVRFPR